MELNFIFFGCTPFLSFLKKNKKNKTQKIENNNKIK